MKSSKKSSRSKSKKSSRSARLRDDEMTADVFVSSAFLNDEISDVTLVAIGRDGDGGKRERFPAHKFVLTWRSEYWRRMFTSSFREADTGEVEVRASPRVVKALLHYVYHFSAEFPEGGMDVLELAYVANQYELEGLHGLCMKYAGENLCGENACGMLMGAKVYGLHELKKAAMDMACKCAEEVVKSDDLYALDVKTLGSLVGMEEFAAEEVDIFHACIRYARHVTGSEDAEQWRELLEDDVIPHIRFPLIGVEEFAKSVFPSGILPIEVGYKLIAYIASNGASGSCGEFCTTPRKGMKSSIPELASGGCELALDIVAGSNYTVEGSSATKSGTDWKWDANVITSDRLTEGKHTWKVVLEDNREDSYILVGVAPADEIVGKVDAFNKCGWYIGCRDDSLWSGPPHSYRGKDRTGTEITREVIVRLDLDARTLSFTVDGRDRGVCYRDIPVTSPLCPCVTLWEPGHRIRFEKC